MCVESFARGAFSQAPPGESRDGIEVV